MASDVTLSGNPPDGFTEYIKRQVIQFFEANATLPHIQLFALRSPCLLKPLEQLRILVEGHKIDGEMVLLCSESDERQRLLRIHMISWRINTMRHHVSNHSILDTLLISCIETVQYGFSDRLQRLALLTGKLGKILVNACGLAFHRCTLFLGLETCSLASYLKAIRVGRP